MIDSSVWGLIDASRQVKTGISPKMSIRPDKSLAEQFAAAQDWWREAGVDFEYSDEVKPLLADEEAEEVASRPQKPAAPIIEKPPEPKITANDLPQGLEAFREWWAGADNPFAASGNKSIAPRGEAGAPVMVVCAMPEANDDATLFAGPHGRLIANILRAINVEPDAAYYASALPVHVTLPDWTALGTDGLGSVLSHHIALAKPQRVLFFSSKLPALIGQDAGAPPESFTQIAGASTLVTFAPDRLLDHTRQRARLWKRLLEWTKPA